MLYKGYTTVDPSFRALSGRLQCMVRRHKFNKDSPPFAEQERARREPPPALLHLDVHPVPDGRGRARRARWPRCPGADSSLLLY